MILFIIGQFKLQGFKVGTVWIMAEEGTKEKEDERKVAEVYQEIGAEMKLWMDKKFFINK